MLPKHLLSMWILGFCVAFAGQPYASAGSVVCRKVSIEDFDDEHTYAVKMIEQVTVAKTTTKIDECVVYVKKINDIVFVHSNFTSEIAFNRGKFHNYPTKIATNDTDDLTTLILNVIYDMGEDVDGTPRRLTTAEHRAGIEGIRDKIRFVVDQKLLPSTGKLGRREPGFDFGEARNLFVDFSDGGPPRRVVRFEPQGSALQWLIPLAEKRNNQLFLRVNSTSRLKEEQKRLEVKPFGRKKFVFVNFLTDLTTEEAIQASRLRNHLVKPDGKPSLEWLRSVFEQCRAGTVALLGHDGNGMFWVKDGEGNKAINIPIETIDKMAAEFDCTVISLGCESGAGALIGVKEKFNSLEAVKRLERSLDSKSIYDFLNAVASPSLPIVVDSADPTPTGQRVDSTVYSATSTNDPSEPFKEIQVAGTISISSPNSAMVAALFDSSTKVAAANEVRTNR